MAAAPPTQHVRSKSQKKNDRKKARTKILKSRLHLKGQKPTRTLRNSARKALRRMVAPYQYIYPAIGDPLFRYNSADTDRAATFLGLPPELRQQILLETVSETTIKDDWDRKMLGQHIGALSCISPLTRMDMKYVGRKWKHIKIETEVERKELDRVEAEKAEALKAAVAASVAGMTHPAVGGFKREIQGRVIEGDLGKKKTKRIRDRKCWYCERRHYRTDPVCPPARENPKLWHSITRSIEYKNPPPFTSKKFLAKKIIFDD